MSSVCALAAAAYRRLQQAQALFDIARAELDAAVTDLAATISEAEPVTHTGPDTQKDSWSQPDWSSSSHTPAQGAHPAQALRGSTPNRWPEIFGGRFYTCESPPEWATELYGIHYCTWAQLCERFSTKNAGPWVKSHKTQKLAEFYWSRAVGTAPSYVD
jgi:hypothetical protein